MRRFLVTVPLPYVGEPVVYHDPDGDWPAIVADVLRDPTEADPLGARVALVQLRRFGTEYRPDVAFGPGPGEWSRPDRSGKPVHAVVEVEGEDLGRLAAAHPAPAFYRRVLGMVDE